MKHAFFAGLLAMAQLICACREAPAGATAPAPTTEAAPAKLVELPPPDPALARVPLGERLAMEASARPELAIRPAQLIDALKAQGVVVTPKRQVLASTLGAAYCELAVSSEGLGVSVCEYRSGELAEAGKARSHEMFDAVLAGRALVRKDNTLLTVTHGEGAAAQSQADTIVSVFSQQQPTSLPTKTALAR